MALSLSLNASHYRLAELKGRWHVESGTDSPMFATVEELLNYYSMTTLLGGVALSVPEEFSTDVRWGHFVGFCYMWLTHCI